MAIGTTAALIGGGIAAASTVAGAIPKKLQATSGVDAGSATDAENFGQGLTLDSARKLQEYVNLGPGASDVAAATGSSRDLASLLDQYSKGGYKPSDEDIASGNDLASKLYQGQRVALNQSFQDQTNAFNQQAALMGRDPLDPVFRNKLAQQQTRDQQLLDANQGAFATQLAMDSPLQRLNFAAQKAQVQGGLASQALANRQALAGLGEGIMTNERNFRLHTASRWGEQTSGGGLGGALTGAIAGLGIGAGVLKGFGFNPKTGGWGEDEGSTTADNGGGIATSSNQSIPGYGTVYGGDPSGQGAFVGPVMPPSFGGIGPTANGSIYGQNLAAYNAGIPYAPAPFSSGIQQFANRYGK